MTTLGGILNIGRGGLLAHQQAIDVTGNNIANANTEGYSRQRVNFVTAPTIHTPIGAEGTGVSVAAVERIVNRFIEPQIQEAIQDTGRWEAEKDVLERVEIVLNEADAYGLNATMGEFFNAWQDLANNPSGYSERASLVAKAETLATTFNQAYGDLAEIQADIDAGIDTDIGAVNTIAAKLTALNSEISSLNSAGGVPNDQLDRQDLLLRELSELIDFTSTTDADHQVTVTLGDGNVLVGAAAFGRLTTVVDAGTGHKDVVWDSATGVDLNGDIGGGRLQGLLAVRDTTVQGYVDDLDALATGAPDGLMAQVNGLHQGGFDLNGDAGLAFFTGSDAGDMALNTAIAADPSLVAAAAEAAGVPGGNGQAIAIAQLQNSGTMSGGTATFDDFYNALVSDVGVAVNTAGDRYDQQNAMVEHLMNYRESISGVSLDEEMVNLVKYQHAYEAAARLIASVDEMMATVIGMV